MEIWYSKNQDFSNKFVWTNGCYDVLHLGHIKMFSHCREIASSLGAAFVVGIDSDRRVKELKGNSRPINCQSARAEILMSVKGVERVYIYDTEEELRSVLSEIRPEVMVIGDDYRDKSVIGFEYCGKLEFFKKIQGYSTTAILSKNTEWRKT